MRRQLPLPFLLAMSLCACGNRDLPAEAQAPQATAPTSSASPVPAPETGLARFDGYGDMRFGMTEAEAKRGWGGDLNGDADAGEACHYLSPVSSPSPSYFAFMIDGGKFVRYDVGNDREVAPGGGRRGMAADEIRALYPGRIAESAHKYVEGGKYLKVAAGDDGKGKLVFETDADGKVSEWHAGIEPQVDYIEGCS